MQAFTFQATESTDGRWLVTAERGHDFAPPLDCGADYHLALKVAWRMNQLIGELESAPAAIAPEASPKPAAPQGGNRVPLIPPAPTLPGGDTLSIDDLDSRAGDRTPAPPAAPAPAVPSAGPAAGMSPIARPSSVADYWAGSISASVAATPPVPAESNRPAGLAPAPAVPAAEALQRLAPGLAARAAANESATNNARAIAEGLAAVRSPRPVARQTTRQAADLEF